MLPPRQSAGCAPAFEEIILEQSRQHSRRLGKLAIDASNVAWRHDEAEREARHAFGAARREAFTRLDALNASYAAKPALAPVPAKGRRFRTGLRNIAANMAGGAAAIFLLLGLAVATKPGPTAAEPIARAPILSPAEAGRMRLLMAQGVAAVLRALGDPSACTDSASLIHPLWRR